jgi:hypothetical protein
MFGAKIHVWNELQATDTFEITRILFGNAMGKQGLGNQAQTDAAQECHANSQGSRSNGGAVAVDDRNIVPGQNMLTPVKAMALFG